MSPAKKPPRPVTRWFFLWSSGEIGNSAWSRKPGKDYIRCRVTPIRPGTDAEIERLAKALYGACGRAAAEYKWESITLESLRRVWLDAARLAWRKGARP